MQLKFNTLVFVGFYVGIYGQQSCTKISSCKCQSEDGIIDLSPLDSGDPKTPKFLDCQDTQGKAKYSFNPCSNFDEGAHCNGVAVCQSAFQDTYTLGNQDSASFVTDKNGLSLQFQGKGEQDQKLRTAHIALKCDPKVDSSFTAKGEGPETQYYMTLTSKYACPKGGGQSGGGLSVGTILCIIVLVLVVVYLVAGIAFNRLKRGATGVEMIPQITFWKDFPFLVKDGALFIYSGCRRKASGYGQME